MIFSSSFHLGKFSWKLNRYFDLKFIDFQLLIPVVCILFYFHIFLIFPTLPPKIKDYTLPLKTCIEKSLNLKEYNDRKIIWTGVFWSAINSSKFDLFYLSNIWFLPLHTPDEIQLDRVGHFRFARGCWFWLARIPRMIDDSFSKNLKFIINSNYDQVHLVARVHEPDTNPNWRLNCSSLLLWYHG